MTEELVDAAIRVVRETLEGLMRPEVATSVLFHAMQDGGGPPETHEQVMALVRGPISILVDERMGAGFGDELLRSIEHRLRFGGLPSSKPPPPAPPEEDLLATVEMSLEDDDDDYEPSVTKTVHLVDRPVPVVVHSPADTLTRILRFALGAHRVAPSSVGDAHALQRAIFARAPLFVLVDAERLDEREVERVARVLDKMPTQTMPVVWGLETVPGRMLERRVRNPLALSLHRVEGIEPVCDLILSRHVGSGPLSRR